MIEYVINELLSNPSAKIQQKDIQYGNRAGGTLTDPWDEDNTQKCSSSPLQSQSVLMVNRDHLARLLFWYVESLVLNASCWHLFCVVFNEEVVYDLWQVYVVG